MSTPLCLLLARSNGYTILLFIRSSLFILSLWVSECVKCETFECHYETSVKTPKFTRIQKRVGRGNLLVCVPGEM